MDTQKKIVTLAALPELLSQGAWTTITGLFDPLTATQAKRLAEFAKEDRKILAIVLDQPDTLLAADARAALVAALASVSAVVKAKPVEWRIEIPADADVEIVEDEAGEKARSREFVEFILQRQQLAQNP